MKIHNKILGIVSTLVVLTIVVVHAESLLALFRPETLVWVHIRDNMLAGYIKNTLFVVMLSMFFAGIIGTLAAYFVSCFEFRFRKLINVLLHLPLAIPPYIGAFVYMDMFQFGGLINNLTAGLLRPSSLWLAVIVFSLFLFPYVYISVKGYIGHSMSSYIENARLLKKSEPQIFFKVIVPIAQTSISSGMILVGLVVLGDFGVSSYLGVQTFSAAIFNSWISFRDFDSSLRLSALVMLMVFSLLILRTLLTRYRHQGAANARSLGVARKQLSGVAAIAPQFLLWSVIVASLGLPLYRLVSWALLSFDSIRYTDLGVKIFNTLSTALLAALVIMILALVMGSFTRSSLGFARELYGKATLVSYAIPGAVLAMVVIVFFIRVEGALGISLSGGIAVLIFGFVLRYLGIGYESIENGFKRIGMKHHEAARTLGKGYYRSLLTVDFPLLRSSIVAGFSLVLLGLLKELPLTLALRPFNFHTLGTWAYQFASDEMLAHAAIPSLLIIAISALLVSAIFFNKGSV